VFLGLYINLLRRQLLMNGNRGGSRFQQRKEYQKKDLQLKLVECPIDKLTTDAPGWANAGSLLGHLAYDKTNGGEDDFVDMPPLEDASDHDRSSRGCLRSHIGYFRTKDGNEFTYCYASQGLRVTTCSTFSYDSY